MTSADRPGYLVMVTGTATAVGKTWVAAAAASHARSQGIRVSARKPAQSYDVDRAGRPLEPTDADVLSAATGEPATTICPPHRWYPLAMAPPMAADALRWPPITVAQLHTELCWGPGTELGFVEAAGGVRSPLAHDGDGATFAHRLQPDLTVLVGDAGLGTINVVRMSLEALRPLEVVVLLNHFDPLSDLHLRNRRWLVERDGCRVAISPLGLLPD